jgi:hypothetical protein
LQLPVDSKRVRIYGHWYTHLKTADGGDLWVTDEGLPFLEQLKPESWRYEDWTGKRGVELEGGTSVPRSVRTREIDGKGIELVVKHSRFGEDAFIYVSREVYPYLRESLTPYGDDEGTFIDSYNNPFREFALLSKMRGEGADKSLRILTQRPLAIYSPSAGSTSTNAGSHSDEVSFDPERSYFLLYGWVKGMDAYSAFEQLGLGRDEMKTFTLDKVLGHVKRKGFVVNDMKTIHIIVRPKSQREDMIGEFRRIPGVTNDIAERMFNAGLTTMDSLRDVDPSLMSKIGGMTPKLIDACKEYPRAKMTSEFDLVQGIDQAAAMRLWNAGYTSWERVSDASRSDLASVGITDDAVGMLKGVARSTVLAEFMRVYDVSRPLAERIYDAGYTSSQRITAAPMNDLMRVEGVTERIAEDCKRFFRAKESGQAKWLLKTRDGEIAYALVDFELLHMTPRGARAQDEANLRRFYALQTQHVEFERVYPPGMFPQSVFGVNYVYSEMPDGSRLWVVGKEPELVDYFIPPKWSDRARSQISERTYRVESADGIHMVCRMSRVGQIPEVSPDTERGRRMIEYGYNSPFEDVAIALDLLGKGFSVIRPRAILMDFHRKPNQDEFTGRASHVGISNRYVTHKTLRTPTRHHLLSSDHQYTNIWSDWRGIDFQASFERDGHWGALGAQFARQYGLITDDELTQLVGRTKSSLIHLGVSATSVTNIGPENILINLDRDGNLIRTSDGFQVTLNTHLENAARTRLLTMHEVKSLLASMRQRLYAAGYEDLGLQPSDFFISFRPDGTKNLDERGQPLLTLVNFNLLRPINPLIQE